MHFRSRWFVVMGGVLMNLALGALYGWSLFVPALQTSLHLNRTQASNIFSMALAAFAIFFLIGGRIQDKKGPYWVSMAGSILFGGGFILSSQSNSLAQLYLTFGLIVGAGAGFGYVTPIAVITKWFPDRRGLVVGIAVGAFGAGSAILGPIVPGWIASAGWQHVMLALGVIYLVSTLLGSQFLRNPPTGWTPAGWKPSAASAAASRVDYTPGQLLRTSHFYRLLIGYTLGISAGLMVISQLLPYAQQAIPGVGAGLAGSAITIGAVGNASGRIFSGWLSDSLGRVRTISLMLLVSAIALPLLGRTHSLAQLWPLLFVVYYCYGTQLSLYASTTADFFGAKNVGANYGLVFLAFGIAGIVGPKLGGGIYDEFHSYTRAFDIAAGLLLASLLTVATLRPPAFRTRSSVPIGAVGVPK
jgi:MFS transporter, OFA family, oxalate/formate antiporter